MFISYYLLFTGRLITAFVTGFSAGCFLIQRAERLMRQKQLARFFLLDSTSINEKMQAVILFAAGSSLVFLKDYIVGRGLFGWLFLCVLFIIGYSDHFIRVIPNEMVLMAIMLWCLWNICFRKPLWLAILEAFLALLFSMGILLVVSFLEFRRKEQMFGRGDIKLLFVVALFMGVEKALYILASACICFLLISVLKGKNQQEKYIPFGPYISFSCFLLMIH